MKVALRTEGPIRGWHQRLGERLAADGHTLVMDKAVDRSLPTGLGLTLALERRLYGADGALFAPVGAAVVAGTGDLVLEARFDGVAGERALVEALLARRVPRVEIVDAAGQTLASGLPAIEAPDILSCGLDHVLARTGQLVVAAARKVVSAGSRQDVALQAGGGAFLSAPAFGARTLLSKLRRKLAPAERRPTWRIAVRNAETPGAELAGNWGGASFTLLANDGHRFEADPFVLEHGDRTCLFFEDFPFATRRGVIAMRERTEDGRWTPSRVVLEEPFHLSYPHLFACEGEVYMLPETSAAGCIRLYRADPFPDRFVPDRMLVEDVVAGDATLVEHAGQWWLFATLAGDGGSTWDALGLFHAPHPFGPWRAHVANPVLIDAGAARPAGEMWHVDGTLMRVAQDCRTSYGEGLAICRVDRLDAAGYAQTVVGRLGPPGGLATDGVHTLNRGGGLEVIDLL